MSNTKCEMACFGLRGFGKSILPISGDEAIGHHILSLPGPITPILHDKITLF